MKIPACFNRALIRQVPQEDGEPLCTQADVCEDHDLHTVEVF